ncbi:hypothetical protein [Paenibacillus sp. MMO-177]|uniref:hypothetical protein n=1 Tax=Paenibacillus sp. MMO-177 TaxID=3081289 RepID=UPI003016EBDB
MKIGMTLLLFLVILLAGCGTGNKNSSETQQAKAKINPPTETTGSSASWPFARMIKFQDRIYVGVEEKVESVEGKLGEIKHLLTQANFDEPDESSNYYKEGTALYQIAGVPVESGIAVEAAPGQYVKALPVEEVLGGSRSK